MSLKLLSSKKSKVQEGESSAGRTHYRGSVMMSRSHSMRPHKLEMHHFIPCLPSSYFFSVLRILNCIALKQRMMFGSDKDDWTLQVRSHLRSSLSRDVWRPDSAADIPQSRLLRTDPSVGTRTRPFWTPGDGGSSTPTFGWRNAGFLPCEVSWRAWFILKHLDCNWKLHLASFQFA